MSIRGALKRRILQDMIVATCGTGSNSKRMVLVLDEHTAKVISSCVRANELIDAGVLAIESIHCKREQLPDFPAIYFLDPSFESVDLLIEDFKDRTQYQAAHIFFTRGCSDAVMDRFQGTRVVKRAKGLVELNVDFTTREDRLFTLGRSNTIPSLYWPQDKDAFNAEILRAARQLVSLCVTLQDEPAVRYDGSSRIAKLLARTMDQQLAAVKDSANWSGRTKGSVLILDRASDLLTPLMHEFTYQAMVGDICVCEGQEIAYINGESLSDTAPQDEKNKRTLILNDAEDGLWAAHRHEHIGLVASGIPSELRKFKKENKLAQWEEDKKNAEKTGKERAPISVKDMAAALRDFNKYTSLVQKFAQHIDLSKECLAKVDARRLKDVAALEQDLATGYNDDGESVDLKRAKNALVQLCQSSELGVEERVRLLLVYLLSQGGLQASARRELTRNIPEQCLGVLHGLEQLGAKVADEKYKAPKADSTRRKEGQARSAELQFLRYVPAIWKLASEISTGKLDPADYPFVSERAGDGAGKSMVRGRRRKDKTGGGGDGDENVDPFVVVFVLGGLTLSEARECYALADELKVNLILGGSEILTPRSFLSSLADMPVDDWVRAAGDCLGAKKPTGKAAAPKKGAAATAGKKKAADSDDEEPEKPAAKGKGSKYEADAKKGGKKPAKKPADSDDDDDESDVEAPDF